MHIHILGICGTFMGGVAALAREAGHRVTGCDAGVYPPMSDQLRALGIELIEGFSADQMALEPDMFVVGNVVSRARLADGTPKFPLMEAILDAGKPYTSGPQWLAEHVLQGRHVLAVAGTHGKTTTTSMLSWILEATGHSPGFLVGGVPLDFERLGATRSDRLRSVRQGDALRHRSRRVRHGLLRQAQQVRALPATHRQSSTTSSSITRTSSTTWLAIERQFHHLVRTVPSSSGRVVVNAAEPKVLERVLAQGCWSDSRALRRRGAQWQAADGEHRRLRRFAVAARSVGRVEWDAERCLHNQMNALAAIAAAEHVGVAPAEAARGTRPSFHNVRRRMELRGDGGARGMATVHGL